MSTPSILTSRQVNFLELFGNEEVSRGFYLSGGTALAAFYIPYRLSEDLDFFSQEEFEISAAVSFLKKIRQDLGYKSLDVSTSFNRNLVFLNFPNEQLKIEFVYFPFPQIKVPMTKFGVKIDSVLDIAVNKLFTIYQKPRSRDFLDLFMINGKYNFSIDGLIKKAKIKFDWHVDLLQLGSQFLLCRELKDYPKLIGKIDEREWQGYFLTEVRKLGTRILV